MKVVGLTGGIATGKSTVSKHLSSSLHIPIVDADLIARSVVEKGQPALKQIAATFGPDVILPDGTLNREKLGSLVFKDAEARKKLNRITHPHIRMEMLRQLLWVFLSGSRVLVMDTPLLLESGINKWVHVVVVVYCPDEIQKDRLMKRDNSTAESASQRIASQMPIENKRKLADIVIDNSGRVEDTRDQVNQVFARITPSVISTALAWCVFAGPAAFVWVVLTNGQPIPNSAGQNPLIGVLVALLGNGGNGQQQQSPLLAGILSFLGVDVNAQNQQQQQQPVPTQQQPEVQQVGQAPVSYAGAVGSNSQPQSAPPAAISLQPLQPITPPQQQQVPHTTQNTTPTQSELSSMSTAMARLWSLDTNRMSVGAPGSNASVILDTQGGKRVYENGDVASRPLFAHVDAGIFKDRPTYSAFYGLLDNYVAEAGTAETFSENEKSEMRRFVDACCETDVMTYLHSYLVAKNVSPPELNKFKNQLWSIWFDTYKRVIAGDSSAFEHCFVGETRNGEVVGFHNWINFFVQEKKGKVNYLGYILPRRRGPASGTEHVLSLQLEWNGQVKPVSTMFIGVSPEFELALYTMVFLASDRDEESAVLDETEVRIKMHRFTNRDGARIGSCYPESS
ncbi:dephospho-CoA kinase [Synchytrium microbalum]|uniref:Dephospho-CoA kinase n=1 Tax=Synchytrium microbalum TaxID=1806994 RepID=A0A507BLR5_9FUNG|nr:dephospho-CoA kinase [Synchytrium microbalum]TPX30637.1 dephospho-CoA kinase [Synchytrium microbalum]